MRKFFNRKTWPLILCFLSPIFIMACYFAYRNMSPFGHQSILTVDLGQQYVDLFANFRHVLLNHPSGLFYSFSKAFGGEMIGTWAYYLMSPLNLLLLLFPANYLPAGILLIILLKYGFSGLSFGYLLSKSLKPRPYLTVMWAIIYALNGWMIANQINVMWLDGVIWLPLIILGVNQIFSQGRSKTFTLTLTLAIITNYYMGYMIFLFVIIYLIFKFITDPLTPKRAKLALKKLTTSLVTCFGLSAWLILPTWYALSQGKAHYSIPKVTNRFEYFPFKMFSKLFNGSLNFDQLPKGTPNLFVGSVALIGFFIYLFRKEISFRKRLGVLTFTAFLIISMCYQPLDLIWHAGQYPIWYPYRFSFLFCFWIIWIAANAINPRYHLSWLSKGLIAGIISALIIYVFINRAQFPFISPLHFILGVLFLLFAFILLLYTHNDTKPFAISLLIFTIFEMGINGFNSLNNLTYLNNDSYLRATKELNTNVNRLKRVHSRNNDYRVGKNFYRSKNDPFNGQYNGGDVFDSSLEYTTPKFMKRIGQPEGHGFVTYSNGTLLSDQLLGFRYFLTTNHYQDFKPVFKRLDLANYPVIHDKNAIKLHENSDVLPLIFTTYPSSLRIKSSVNPIYYQNHWYDAITHHPQANFKRTYFNNINLINLKTQRSKYRLINPLKPGYLTLKINPKINEADYLVIRPQVSARTASLSVNGRPFLPKTAYNHSLILNLSDGLNKRPIHLRLRLNHPSLSTNDIRLYQLNRNRVLNHSYYSQIHLTHFSNCRITGTIKTTTSKKIMGTSIPATKGWHLKIDGKPKPIHRIANEFIGAKTRPGKHTFTLIYIPPRLPIGITITIITILACFVIHHLYHDKQKGSDHN